MKNTNRSIGLFFLLGGMALIIAIFLLFLKDMQAADLLCLNMTACCLAYAITFISVSDLLGPVDQVKKAAPGYGLRWTATWIYLPAVTATVTLSIILGLGFNLCLILQIAYLFGFLMMTALSVAIAHNVAAHETKETVRKSGLNEIQTNIAILEAQCATNAAHLAPKVARIKEEIRYITASDSPAASALEAKILKQIALVAVRLESPVTEPDSVGKELDACMTLIELRKKQY